MGLWDGSRLVTTTTHHTQTQHFPPNTTPTQADFYHADQFLPQSDEAIVARVKRYIAQVRFLCFFLLV